MRHRRMPVRPGPQAADTSAATPQTVDGLPGEASLRFADRKAEDCLRIAWQEYQCLCTLCGLVPYLLERKVLSHHGL
jgi:hypothetical protein